MTDRNNEITFFIVTVVGWGIMMVILFIVFIPSLFSTGKSDKKKDIMAEYDKLKSRNSNS